MGSVGNKVTVHNQLGVSGKDLWELNYDSFGNAARSINPNYGSGAEYSSNCALCSTAAMLSMRGYDVEAQKRDKEWRGPVDVFDFDYRNYDNYISPADSKMNVTGMKWADSQFNPNKFTKDTEKNVEIIENALNKWGNNSYGELIVGWSRGNRFHSVIAVNHAGKIKIIDFQTGETYTVKEYLSRTRTTPSGRKKQRIKAGYLELKRMDNAPIKQNIPDLNKMVKKKVR